MPLVALVEGKPYNALDPEVTKAECRDPHCSAPMHRRASKGLTPHWVHNPGFGERCEVDRDVSEWHVAWQLKCTDMGRVEYAANGRRADVLTPFGWAIEFQHSNIARDTIRGREDDWSGQLVWVHDGTVESAGTLELNDQREMRWLGAPSRIMQIRCLQMVDVGDETLVVLPSRLHLESGDVVSTSRVWTMTHDEFTSRWINGPTPPAACGYVTRWTRERTDPPKMRAAPKPRSHKLAEALETARVEQELGTAAGTCERAETVAPQQPAAMPTPPRMAVAPRLIAPVATTPVASDDSVTVPLSVDDLHSGSGRRDAFTRASKVAAERGRVIVGDYITGVRLTGDLTHGPLFLSWRTDSL